MSDDATERIARHLFARACFSPTPQGSAAARRRWSRTSEAVRDSYRREARAIIELARDEVSA